ncbi:G-type lectin S-receptor-like serine/threonine-protein kinase At4g27290 isoform X2 [Zingiber officinale]|uniref:G-type lectin S-receptor-like serine/threonine-protein kinase At4g27290 isoform X2 n=1 Tax=Zingiber officinale TaxID=94328 RepID=UPI001C4B9F71|nr:G-type lectin S-receptor-like serine/threonine-protein kinase At4g27290 isoform X2 [Zingiber officinale]
MARMQRFLFQFLNILAAISIVHCQTSDSLTPNSSLRNDQSLTSSGGIFQLGFFTPISGSVQGYIAIWYNNSSITERTIVWIANRNQSVNTSTATLNFTSDGNLILFDNGTDVSWSTGTSTAQNSAQVQLLDSGNLVLTVAGDGGSKKTLWQSFDHPSDTFLPGMRLGVDYRNNTSWQLVSWKSVTNPSPGNYAFKMETRGVPEIFLWNGSSKIYRTGPWNDKGSFSGNPRMKNKDISSQLEFNFVSNSSMVYYSTQYKFGSSVLTRAVINASGKYERWSWTRGGWSPAWNVPVDDCDVYARCGRNSICNWDYISFACDCLEGFAPKNGSLGCNRKKPLSCASNRILKVANAKLPDTENATIRGQMSLGACNDVCTNDCSCVAYAMVGENGCVTWEGDLVDLRNFTEGGDDLYIRLAGSSMRSQFVWKIAVPVFLASLLLCIVFFWWGNRAGKQDCSETGPESSSVKDDTSLLMCPSKGGKRDCRSLSPMAFDASDSRSRSRSKSIDSETYGPCNEGAGRLDILGALPSYDLSTIKAATNDFSIDNKLGEGGFGVVYMLQDGQKIAVKKLSRHSLQGPSEFQNELSLIAKLQHRNLLRVLGSCIQGDERLIILEYMENKSLDSFIYDKTKGALLSWQMRLEIINGIARGLLYLHQDSILRIIHRDLKPSNILLDKDMTPKISDFGTARIFEGDGAPMNATTRPVGTFGYMAPEYLAHGLFSFKSDVFSFGVLVLEILSGKRNMVFNQTDMSSNLLVQAYTLWKEGRSLELLDDALDCSYPIIEILRCIRMALLCVQENSEDRPAMTEVVMMLASEDQLLIPLKQPLIKSIACESGLATKEMSSTLTGR